MYRRRRLVLLIALIAVGALVWLLIAQPWNAAGTPAPAQSPSVSTPAPTTDVTESSEPTGGDVPPVEGDATGGVPQCTRDIVTVEALTDASSYAADQNPQLSIRLTNTSEADCSINVGTSAQSFTVTSGSDAWWRSTDCQSEPSDMIVTLEAGQIVTSASPITWDRTRSSVDTCSDDSRANAPAGGASYHLAVEIGGIPSTTTAQFILN